MVDAEPRPQGAPGAELAPAAAGVRGAARVFTALDTVIECAWAAARTRVR